MSQSAGWWGRYDTTGIVRSGKCGTYSREKPGPIMIHMSGVVSDGAIEVVNKYQWVGNPRQGRFHVSIDGAPARLRAPSGFAPGHVFARPPRVRISLWHWYWSQRADVDVPQVRR